MFTILLSLIGLKLVGRVIDYILGAIAVILLAIWIGGPLTIILLICLPGLLLAAGIYGLFRLRDELRADEDNQNFWNY